MALDIGTGVLILLFLVSGYASGLLVQVLRLAVLVGTFMGAWYVSAPAAELMADKMEMSANIARVIVFVVGWIIFYAIAWALAHKLIKKLKGKEGNVPDKLFGAILGAAKGGFISYLILAILVTASIPMATSHPDFHAFVHGSYVGRWVSKNNVISLDKVPYAKAIYRLGLIAQDPEKLSIALNDPNFKQVLESPKAEWLREPAMQKALAEKDWETLVGDSRVWDFVTDPDLMEALEKIEIEEEKTPEAKVEDEGVKTLGQ